MAKETVDRILEAEKMAEAAEADALARAARLISDAEGAAEKIIAQKRLVAEERAEKMISDALAEAEKIVAEAADSTQEGFRISQLAYNNKEEAINACLEKIIQTGGR